MHAEKLSVSVNTIELSTSYGKMANLATGVAATIGGTSAQTQSRAVSLDMTESLAVIALLGWILSVSVILVLLFQLELTLGSAWGWAVV